MLRAMAAATLKLLLADFIHLRVSTYNASDIKPLMTPVRRMTVRGSIRLMGISGFNPVAPFWS